MKNGTKAHFAVLTPPGRGGIAVIRVQGPGAIQALGEIFRPSKKDLAHFEPGRIYYGHVHDADGRVLDEVIVSITNASVPAEALDINCHGGSAAVQAVGARLAELGVERRSADDLNALAGIDPITRAAVRLLPVQATELAVRTVLCQLGGALGAEVQRIAESISQGQLPEASKSLGILLSRWEHVGRPLTQPSRVAVAGRPNAGKSTLINALVGAERVITSPTPGTTRDYVEAIAAIDGVPVMLVDTAGLGETEDALEQLSAERARRELTRADVVIWLLDGAKGIGPEDAEIINRRSAPVLIVWNKADVAPPPEEARADLAISATTGENLDALGSAVLRMIGYHAAPAGAAVPFTPEQARQIKDARQMLDTDADHARRRLLAMLGQG